MTTISEPTGPNPYFPYAYQEDARLDLQARIANALHWSLAIPRNRIEVRVEGRWVTLRGVVSKPCEKSYAEAIARRVEGVVGVHNEIEVRPENLP